METNLRRSCFVIVTAVVMVADSLAAGPGPEQGKKTIVEAWHGTPAVEASLERAYDAASAVMRVRVESGKAVAGAEPDPVHTDYTCRVLESLKGDARLTGEQAIIRRLGGSRDEGSVVRRLVVEGFPDFAPGEEYMLFLKWHKAASVWLAYAEGSYEVMNGRMEPKGRSQHAKQSKGEPVEAFTARLSKMRK